MPNQRLRSAFAPAGLTQPGLAERVEVDAKSVERWITQDRTPHASTRARVAQLLGHDETYFWPRLLGTDQSRDATTSELVQLWPSRNLVPGDVWRSLFRETTEQLDILVYAANFLIEAYDLVEVIGRMSHSGARTRILLGDAECEAVRVRGEEEGLPTIVDRCRSSLDYLRAVGGLPGVSIRTHETTLYSSIFRFDNSMLVNNHSYGRYAAQSPVLHLRRVAAGQLFDHYEASFDRVWATAKP